MTSTAMNQEEMNGLVNDLIKDMEEQKAARKEGEGRLTKLEEGQQELYTKLEALETKVAKETAEGAKTADGLATLNFYLHKELNGLKEQLNKQQLVAQEARSRGLLGDRVRAENFNLILEGIIRSLMMLVGTFTAVLVIYQLLERFLQR